VSKPKWQIRDVDHGKIKSFDSWNDLANWVYDMTEEEDKYPLDTIVLPPDSYKNIT